MRTIPRNPDLTDIDRLRNLTDALVEDILTTPDDDLIAEAIEDGQDPHAAASECRAIIDRAIARHDALRAAKRKRP